MAGVALRLRTLGRRLALDEALADGADPIQDPELALRAQQLVAPSTRRAIANTIGNLIDAAEEPRDSWAPGGPRPPLQAEAIVAARRELIAIARRFSGEGPVPPQAAALAARLVWDSASPVYAETDWSVWEWAQAVLEALPSGSAAA